MAKLQSDSGGDPTNDVTNFLESRAQSLTRDVIDIWFKNSQDWLRGAEKNRSEIGKRHGVRGRKQNDLGKIVQSASPPTWDDGKQRWTFSYVHPGAVFQEFGATPHEIRAKKAEVLAFEWPDAPQEVEEMFEHTEGDLVFFKSVDHPGLPAVGFVRYGRDVAIRELEEAGYDATTWEEDNR